MPVILKEEDEEVIDVDLLEANEQQGDHDSDLIPLGEAQWNRLKYPPSCPVVFLFYQDNSSLVNVLEDTVDAAFLHFYMHKINYKLKQSGRVVPESQLQFGRGAPVWAIPPGETHSAPAVVLYVSVRPSDGDSEVLYSVQREDEESKTVHHFLPAESINYRLAGSAAPAPAPVPSTGQNSSEANRHSSSGQSAGASSRQEVREESNGSDAGYPGSAGSDCDHRRRATSSRSDSGNHSNRSRSREGDRQSGRIDERCHHPEPARRRYRGTFSSQDKMEFNSPQACKRQRSRDLDDDEIVVQSLLLPSWFSVEQVKDHFSFVVKAGILEKATGCRLSLRGRAIERDPPVSARLYIEIKGRRGWTDYAIECFEDAMLDPTKDMDVRCLMMYDIARDNRGYRRDGSFLYQRSPLHPKKPWRWMTCEDFPKDWNGKRGRALMVGPSGRGVHEMIGNTTCDIRICAEPRGCVILFGESLNDMKASRDRVLRRIEWADNTYDRSV